MPRTLVWELTFDEGTWHKEAYGYPGDEGFVEFDDKEVIVWPWHRIERCSRTMSRSLAKDTVTVEPVDA